MSKKFDTPAPVTNMYQKKKTSALTEQLFKNAEIPVLNLVKQTWEDIEGLYRAIGEALIGIGANINECVSLINNAGTATVEVVKTVKGLNNDLLSFSDTLVKIHKRHEGSTGVIETEEAYALAMSIYTDYVSLNERLQAVTFNSMLTISETAQSAAEIIKANKAKQDLVNPAIITDVEFTETKDVRPN